MPRITWFRWWNLRKFDFKLASFDGFTMGLRPIFEPNGWENGFTEGHFGGEISPISLTDFRQKSGWNGMKNSVRFVWRVLTNSAKIKYQVSCYMKLLVWKTAQKRRNSEGILLKISSVFPYVGIIQIRLRVETIQFPLSQLQPAPLFHIELH